MDPGELALRTAGCAHLLLLSAALLTRRDRNRTIQVAALLPIGLAVLSAVPVSDPRAWLLGVGLPLAFLGSACPAWITVLGDALAVDTLTIEARPLLPAGGGAVAVAWQNLPAWDPADSSGAALLLGGATLLAVAGLAGLGFARRRRPADGAARATAADPPRTHDAALAVRVRAAMEVERLYHREDLTVATLATALGCREYQVRRAINVGLGQRNFNEFLHGYRLREAAERLRSQPHLPVLTIALDVGYGSIGPFNRAFRARYAMTPTEYRRGSASRPAAGEG